MGRFDFDIHDIVQLMRSNEVGLTYVIARKQLY